MVTILKCSNPKCSGHGGNSPIQGPCANSQFNLLGADLRSADLLGANLRDADLLSANLLGANLRDADLRSADLNGADLRSADLRDADLRSASLLGANLRDANLLGANLRSADLRSANLNGANLRDANLLNAKGILTAGPCEERVMVAVRHSAGPMIQAGCHWEKPAWLRAHWTVMLGGDRDQHAQRWLACLESLLGMARACNWEM
jgi:hypothetical protein